MRGAAVVGKAGASGALPRHGGRKLRSDDRPACWPTRITPPRASPRPTIVAAAIPRAVFGRPPLIRRRRRRSAISCSAPIRGGSPTCSTSSRISPSGAWTYGWRKKTHRAADAGVLKANACADWRPELGTAREVVSRQLAEFQRRGWVAQSRDTVGDSRLRRACGSWPRPERAAARKRPRAPGCRDWVQHGYVTRSPIVSGRCPIHPSAKQEGDRVQILQIIGCAMPDSPRQGASHDRNRFQPPGSRLRRGVLIGARLGAARMLVSGRIDGAATGILARRFAPALRAPI